MSNEIIGIKQADGSFYPILQDGKPDNKTIELTTVRDGQTTAQIHLYKKEPGSIDEPAYVDTLLIEHLVPHPKQEPTINLNINLDENNVLTAKVVDPETGNSSDIRVSLVTVPESQLQAQSDFTVTDAEPVFAEDAEPETIDESAANKTDDFSFDMPDFDSDNFNTNEFDTPAEKSTESKDDSAGFDDFNLEDSDLNFDSAEDTETDFVKAQSATKENPPLYDLNLPDDIDETGGKKKCRIPMLICIICAILCILAVIGIFLRLPWKNRGGTQTADANIVTVEPPDQKEQPEDAVPPAPEENTIVIVEQEKVEKQEVIPEKTEPAPEAKPQTVRYLIKWGDTLWDLSDTYYRNPWLYPIIARENKIKNPDLIIAGTYINIPPR